MKFLLPLLITGLAHAASPITVIPSPVDHLFIPAGFDNNDNVEVVVTGHFPSTCYARNRVDVKVVKDLIDIKVTAFHRRDSSIKCLDMSVPYTEVVTVGNLQAGNYKIQVNEESKGIKDNLVISESRSNNMDEFIYAQVDYIDLGFAGGATGSAFIHAQLPSPCLEFDHVEYLSNGKDTISIMPIMKQVSDFCPMKMVPYEIPIKYDLSTVTADKVLLFSRSIDGRSVSTIMNR